jgi:multidrug efflux system outer membrane protein
MALPQGWSSVDGVGLAPQPSTTPFWQEFGSADLNRLIDLALAQNLDLEAALHRIEQARAQAKVAGSPLYPNVSASGSASRTFQDSKNTTSVRGGGSISYEVDLWGKNRNFAQSANYRVDASQFDREALRLVVTSDVTDFYSQILSLNDRIRIAEFNLKNAEEILRIIEARFAQGGVSGLEVSQQRVAVNGFRTALAPSSKQRSTTANALAILLGRAPQNLSTPAAELASLKMPQVNLTLAGNLVDRAARYSKRRGRLAQRQRRYRRGTGGLFSLAHAGCRYGGRGRLRRPGERGNCARVELARADIHRRRAYR